MTHQRVMAGSFEYDVALDDRPLVAHRWWAIALGQIIDDLNDASLIGAFDVCVAFPGEPDEIGPDGRRYIRRDHGITVKRGADGTFALVARPWLRFTPFVVPRTVTVAIEAERFVAQRRTFTIAYDQRTVNAPAVATDRTVTLNSTTSLFIGQTLLFGPQNTPQYARIQSIAGNQVTLEAGLIEPQAVGDAVFPDGFTAPPPVTIRLRRLPVRISGRVVERNTSTNTFTALANASVAITDCWRTRADAHANQAHGVMTVLPAALRQFPISVAPGALATRTAGATTAPVNLPGANDDRLLAQPAAAAHTRLDITSCLNLQPVPGPLPNRLLLVEPDDRDAAEYQTVRTVQPSGAPDEPGRLELELPLARRHREHVRLSRINAPALPAAVQTLVDDAAAGDRCLFLDDLAGFPAPPPPFVPDSLYLTGGGAVDEFQRFELFAVQSNGNGDFVLPPVQRMARLALTVDDGVRPARIIEVEPAYDAGEQRIEVVYLV